jgi:hypothetical protein
MPSMCVYFFKIGLYIVYVCILYFTPLSQKNLTIIRINWTINLLIILQALRILLWWLWLWLDYLYCFTFIINFILLFFNFDQLFNNAINFYSHIQTTSLGVHLIELSHLNFTLRLTELRTPPFYIPNLVIKVIIFLRYIILLIQRILWLL